MEIRHKIPSAMLNTGARWKRRFFSFITSAPALILTISVIMIIVSIICMTGIVRSRPERNAASVWSQGSEVPYRHMAVYSRGGRASGDKSPSAYTAYGESLAKTDIYNLRKSLQGIVDLANGIKRRSSDKPIDPEGWADAYCSYVTAETKCTHQDYEVTSDAEIYAVGGNFRAFHPYEFMSGGFLPVQSVDKYQIVLNDELSWKFFSSYDVIGNRVSLWGKEFTIIGVVREHGGHGLRAYVYYDCLEEYCSGLENPVTPAVLCYEAMLPEQVKNVAVMDVTNSVPGYDISDPNFYIVSITDRFSIPAVYSHMMPPGKMSGFLRAYDLPFWEDSAQLDISSMFSWMVVTAFFVVLSLCMVIMLVRTKIREDKRQ